MSRFLLPTFVCLTLIWPALAARANIILYDSQGFENFDPGNVVGQFGWTQENDAIYTIQSAVTNGGNRALEVSRDAEGAFNTDWAYTPSLNFTPGVGQLVTIEADIARTLDEVAPSFAFAVDVFDGNLERITRFGLRHDAGDIRGFYTAVDPDTNAVANFFATAAVFSEQEFVSFRADLNFDTQRVELFVNGVSVTGAANIYFATLAAVTTLRDIGFQISSNSSAADSGYLDNLRVTAVPEPSSLLLLLATAPIVLKRRRRA